MKVLSFSCKRRDLIKLIVLHAERLDFTPVLKAVPSIIY